jgi:O-methyltransferase involved in polyketide biosynthesis
MRLDPPGPGEELTMADEQTAAPDSTAVRVALWRALHVQVDPPPHVLADEIGLRLAAPDDAWRDRGDMHPTGTSRYRAGILARSRFAEDLVAEQAARGVTQYYFAARTDDLRTSPGEELLLATR